MRILFLTEAGEGIGFGHISRISALHSTAISKGIDSFIIVNCKGNFELLKNIPGIIRHDWLNETILPFDICDNDIVVLDSYLADDSFFNGIRKLFKKIIVLDDYVRMQYPVDIVINPNIAGTFLDYSNQKGSVFAGSPYVILRPEFVEEKQKVTLRSQVRNILISVGGSDYKCALPRLIGTLAVPNTQYHFHILAANDAYKNELSRNFPFNNISYYSLLSAEEMKNLFFQMDLVITAAGQTLNELAYIGLPTISFSVDVDQNDNLKAFFKEQFIIEKIWWDEDGMFNKLQAGIRKLKDLELRKKLAFIGNNLIDGYGSDRIINLICGER